MKKNIAISLGDLNGIGLQLALQNHKKISKICNPIYCIDKKLLNQGAKLLNIKIPKDFNTYGEYSNFSINPGKVCSKSGLFSYNSFLNAIKLTKNNDAHAICTLPINKESWKSAQISYVGHTDMLRDIFQKDAIMMLGCSKMYVALFTEHIPLKKVAKTIKTNKVLKFLLDLYKCLDKPKTKIAVLALNPHAGDNGVLGDEDFKIKKAIKKANKLLKDNIFEIQVPDIAFTHNNRKKYKYFAAMYHDQGLIPLKALYFDQSINVSLNLPIIRTSVDHGTAFDIAYKKQKVNSKSYINAIIEATKLKIN